MGVCPWAKRRSLQQCPIFGRRPKPGAVPICDQIITLTKFPKDNPNVKDNIEALLSYCKIGVDFNEDDNKTLISKFITETEEIIRDEVNFLAEDDGVEVHF
jgi:hypothetical protein